MKNKQHLLALTLLLFSPFSLAQGFDTTEHTVANAFKKIQQDPIRLYEFLAQMPKGGELHTHFSGATYAENLLAYSRQNPFCIFPEHLLLHQ